MNAQECLKGLTEIAKALWLPTGVLPYINKAYECVQAIEQAGEELPVKAKTFEHRKYHGLVETDKRYNAGWNDAIDKITPLYAKRLLEIEELKAEVDRLKGGK